MGVGVGVGRKGGGGNDTLETKKTQKKTKKQPYFTLTVAVLSMERSATVIN